jgi:hypothetical protein
VRHSSLYGESSLARAGDERGGFDQRIFLEYVEQVG